MSVQTLAVSDRPMAVAAPNLARLQTSAHRVPLRQFRTLACRCTSALRKHHCDPPSIAHEHLASSCYKHHQPIRIAPWGEVADAARTLVLSHRLFDLIDLAAHSARPALLGGAAHPVPLAESCSRSPARLQCPINLNNATDCRDACDIAAGVSDPWGRARDALGSLPPRARSGGQHPN